MKFCPAVLLNLGAIQVSLATPFTQPYVRDVGNSSIQWGPCKINATVPVQCATLPVPLDYTDTASDKTLNLSLIRTPATTKDSKGSILFNFGGPGFESVNQFAGMAKGLLQHTGGQHDLIAFDPRGTGETIPFSCFDTPAERALANAEYPIDRSDSSDVALGELWANSKVMANTCGEKMKEIGGLVGTSFVARDMMQIVDALKEDGKLRYWGISYGTILGAVVADMFPDRMDSLIFDGVVNGHHYYYNYGMDLDQLLTADDAFRGILAECIEAGDRCAISTVNNTAEELETTLTLLADEYKRAPVAVGATVIDYNLVMALYLLMTKYPNDVPNAMRQIKSLLDRHDLAAVAEYFSKISGAIDQGGEGLIGIKCSDAYPRTDEFTDIIPAVEYVRETSTLFADTMTGITMECAQWPFEAKERYSGHFNVKTPNPVLFIGNTYDAATPVASARNVSATFDGSVVVERDGFGHGSLSQSSSCIAGVIQAYFSNGTLPEDGTFCEVDDSIFDEKISS